MVNYDAFQAPLALQYIVVQMSIALFNEWESCIFSRFVTHNAQESGQLVVRAYVRALFQAIPKK
jgi:hypothetical protein